MLRYERALNVSKLKYVIVGGFGRGSNGANIDLYSKKLGVENNPF